MTVVDRKLELLRNQRNNEGPSPPPPAIDAPTVEASSPTVDSSKPNNATGVTDVVLPQDVATDVVLPQDVATDVVLPQDVAIEAQKVRILDSSFQLTKRILVQF